MSQYANPGIFRRIIVLVLEGYGVGAQPDAGETRDRGTDTLGHLATYTGGLNLPMLQWMGLGDVAAVRGLEAADPPAASFGRLARTSAGTDVDGALAELLDGLLEELVASGNEVIAIVALRDDATAAAEDLREAAAAHIARYKLPKQVVFVDEVDAPTSRHSKERTR